VRVPEPHRTLEDVAQELGVTREWARQIERQALRKCYRWCKRNGWRAPTAALEEVSLLPVEKPTGRLRYKFHFSLYTKKPFVKRLST
jgi:hypothetical protein